MSNPNLLDKSTTDVRSPIGVCPAWQNEVFIVPVRYALSEHPAQHSCFSPPGTTESHPMALRRLRAGYLYLWHAQGPLKRYAIAADGCLQLQGLDDPHSELASASDAGIALKKTHDAWLLYTERPIGSEHYKQLENAQQRSARMRKIALPQVAIDLHSTHSPRLEDASTLLAELMPEVREQALAEDQQKNGKAYAEGIEQLSQRMLENPSFDNIKSYTDAMLWQDQRDKAAAKYPDASEQPIGQWSAVPWDVSGTEVWLQLAQSQAAGLWSVFAAVDDDLGVLRDINHEQEQLEADHSQWVADNNIRLTVGGFVRSLIQENGGEVASMLNYRFQGHDIRMTSEQGELMLESQHQLDQLLAEETRTNQGRGQIYSHESADALLRKIHRDIEATLAPVKQFLPAELNSQAQIVISQYRKSKVSNLEGGQGSAKVAEYIDLERMNTWLEDTAPAHFQYVEKRHEALYADRGQYLRRHSSGTWFVDYEASEQLDWLDQLAVACLSAQCIRQLGAEQFNTYIRSPDEGALHLVFMAWSPSLEGVINSQTRISEIVEALSSDNLANSRALLAQTLDESALRALDRVANDVEGVWAAIVSRLGASLLALKSQGSVSKQWLATLISVRLGNDAWLTSRAVNGTTVWQLLGSKAKALNDWSKRTAEAIGLGSAKDILDSPAIKNSGGLLPLAALLLNGLNAENYLNQAANLDVMDQQRMAETVSASLYAAAALTAVVDSWVRVGRGIQVLRLGKSFAPALTLFGGLIGLLSAVAARNELVSIQTKIESAQSRIDPWLDIRREVVVGQYATFAAQAILGFGLTAMRLSKVIDTTTAISRYRLGMGPINLLLLGLGVAYFYSWWKQATPVQSFLAGCCWSKFRTLKYEKIPSAEQVSELEQLLDILYAPRVSIETSGSLIGSTSYIKQLSIDLPGAVPTTARLAFALAGNPVYMSASHGQSLFGGGRMIDIGAQWLNTSECTWIPADEGQGLRLTGPFLINDMFGSQPSKVSMRLGYHSPIATLAGVEPIIGGVQGLALTVDSDGVIIELRSSEMPSELTQATIHPLGNAECSIYLQPKGHP